MENDQINTIVEKKEDAQTQSIAQPNSEVETPEQINWKKFRETREQERRQLEDERKRSKLKEEEAMALKAAMDAILNKKPSQENNDDHYLDETEDEKIQKKVEAALAIRERQLEDERRKREQAEFPKRLNETYSDFNQVCTTENLDYLEFHYPELAAPFKHMPDGFDKWSSIYKTVKRFIPNIDSKKEQKKAEKNFSKPQSMATAGVTQTGDSAPMILDDKRRADNWARMQRTMKGTK